MVETGPRMYRGLGPAEGESRQARECSSAYIFSERMNITLRVGLGLHRL